MTQNMKKIAGYIRVRQLWQGLMIAGILGMLLTIFIWLEPTLNLRIGLISLAVFSVLILVIELIVSATKTNKVRKAIRRQGTLESFERDPFRELGSSKNIFVNSNWLMLFQDGRFDHFPIGRISRAENYGERDSARRKNVVNLVMNDGSIKGLVYQNSGIDMAAEINHWLGIDSVKKYYQVCPLCGAPLNEEDEFCGNCGTRLSKEDIVDPFPTQTLSTAPIRAVEEPYKDHTVRVVIAVAALVALGALIVYLWQIGVRI